MSETFDPNRLTSIPLLDLVDLIGEAHRSNSTEALLAVESELRKRASVLEPREYPEPLSRDDFVEIIIDADVFSAGEMRDAADDRAVEIAEEFNPASALITGVKIFYPRASRYGVPEAETDQGAKKYLANILDLGISRTLEIQAEDTGDDTPERYEITALVHRSLVQYVEQHTPREV